MDISCRGKMIHLLLLLLELRDELAVVQLLGQLYKLGFPKRRDLVNHSRIFPAETVDCASSSVNCDVNCFFFLWGDLCLILRLEDLEGDVALN